MRYLESGDFIGRLCFLLGRFVPCRRRPAGERFELDPRPSCAPPLPICRLHSITSRLRVVARNHETRQREGLSAESMVLTAAAIGLPAILARTARRFDLTTLPQAGPEGDGFEEAMIETALLGSGAKS
jgi:hypothetical protein